MKRRDFIAGIGGTVALPLVARAQQSDRKRLVGVLMGYAENDPAAQSEVATFGGALAKLGWTEGRISASNFAGAPVMRIR